MRLLRKAIQRLAIEAADGLRNQHWDDLQARGVVTVGRHSYGVPEVLEWRGPDGESLGGRVRIGSFVSIAEEVEILTGGDHRVDWVSCYPFRRRWGLPGAYRDGHPASRGDVVIGNDVWIARGARILSGVTIGNGAVVGACAVVARDVPPYSIAVGNPAVVVRRRFSDEQIKRLQDTAWWEWPDEKILPRVPLLCGDDVDAFLAAAADEG